jgi:predicted secreted protein
MALASKALRLFADTTSTAADAVDGVRTCVFNRGRDLIDITTFGTAGAVESRKRLAALQDGTIDISGTHLLSDTGLNHVRTGFNDGTDIYWRMLYDGTNGDEVQAIVENYNLDADVTRDINFSSSMSRNGTLVAVP